MPGAGGAHPFVIPIAPNFPRPACDLRALRQPAMHPKKLWKEGRTAEVADPAIFSSPSSYLPRQKTDARREGRKAK